MTVFLDASALVALIENEPERPIIEAALEADEVRITSGLALWETVRAITRGGDVSAGWQEVGRYRASLGIAIVPIGPAETSKAVQAHARYGKGTGHPAKLNMGDCFAYACAKTNNASLLYKGGDFLHTDIG